VRALRAAPGFTVLALSVPTLGILKKAEAA
jgi:hypothetical protein